MVRVRYACIGCGGIANAYHLPALAQVLEAEFVVACDLDEQRARETAGRFHAAAHTTDWLGTIARSDVDLVCVFTKVQAHAEIAIAAARAGKHVFIQKPFARSVPEGRAMVAAAERAGTRIIPAFMHRYFDESLLAAQLVREGAVGRIEFIRQRNGTRNPRETVASFGGAMLDIGAHGIDLIRAISGEEIVSVCSRIEDASDLPELSDPDAEDERSLLAEDLNAFSLYELSSGATVSHEVQWSEAAGTSRFQTEVYGTHGTILVRVPRTGADLAYFTAADSDRPTGQPVEWVVPDLPRRPMGLAHHETVIRRVLGGDDTAQNAEDGLAVLKVCEAARVSQETGGWADVV